MEQINTVDVEQSPIGNLFRPCNAGQEGTPLTHDFMSGLMMELINAITKSCQTPIAFDKNNPNSYNQIWLAITRFGGSCGIPSWSSGVTNNIVMGSDCQFYLANKEGDPPGNDPVGGDGSHWKGPFCSVGAVMEQITVDCCGNGNLPPVANAGAAQSVKSGDAVTLDSSTSFDLDGEVASQKWTQTGGPAVVFDDDLTVKPLFTAPEVTPGECKTLEFELTVVDNGGAESVVDKVSIEVCKDTPPNNPPVAVGDSYSTSVDTPLALDPSVLANDSDVDGDTLSVDLFDAVTSGDGAVELVNGELVYIPAAGFEGVDSFNYTISDGKGGSGTASVSIKVLNINCTTASLAKDLNGYANFSALSGAITGATWSEFKDKLEAAGYSVEYGSTKNTKRMAVEWDATDGIWDWRKSIINGQLSNGEKVTATVSIDSWSGGNGAGVYFQDPGASNKGCNKGWPAPWSKVITEVIGNSTGGTKPTVQMSITFNMKVNGTLSLSLYDIDSSDTLSGWQPSAPDTLTATGNMVEAIATWNNFSGNKVGWSWRAGAACSAYQVHGTSDIDVILSNLTITGPESVGRIAFGGGAVVLDAC